MGRPKTWIKSRQSRKVKKNRKKETPDNILWVEEALSLQWIKKVTKYSAV